MCGLVGIAGKLGGPDEATMKRLFLLDFFRGPDSTGLAAIRSKDDEAFIAKIANHPLDLFEMPKFKTALSGHNSWVFLGHNRMATRGGVNDYNAHPFECGDIVGAHNGTLDLQSTKALEDALGESFPVDSQALIAGIATLGVKKTFALCNEGKHSTDGAWAVVWYDKKDRSLNFLRNKHRPLWYAFTEDFDRIFWASEWPMIDAAVRMSQAGHKLWKDSEGYSFFWCADDTHYKFDVETIKNGGKKRPKAKIATIKGKEPTPVVTPAGTNPFGRNSQTSMGFHHTHSRTNSSTTNSHGRGVRSTASNDGKLTHIHLNGDSFVPFSGVIDEERFHQMAQYGCVWCEKDIEWGDIGITIFDRDSVMLCEKCSGWDIAEANPATKVFIKGALMDAYK